METHAASQQFAVGDRVSANFPGKSYPGTVVRIYVDRGQALFEVRLDGNQEDVAFHPSWLELLTGTE